ncbi:hypothetical protein SK128_011922 [Halocaridina rubra]|uniref:Uncharacterized protein n=1 Tax=Halocaridina rubra TaxID=373956 RepID=A0AAN8XS42_HALRR
MALSGRHLRIAAGNWLPWATLEHDESGQITNIHGLIAIFMEIFASKLNFTYTIVEAPDGEWGRVLPNGTVTGMIGLCYYRKVDMAFGPFNTIYSRFKVIDYSEAVYIDRNGIFLPRPVLERDLTGFVKPFSWQVWTTLLAFLLGSIGLGIFLRWLVNQWHMSFCSLPDEHITFTFRAQWLVKLLLAEGIEIPRTLWSSRVFLGTWMVVSLILGSAYQGILTSLLAVPKAAVPVDSLEDLVNNGKMKWALESGTALHQYFGDAEEGIQKEISDGAFYVYSCNAARERMKTEKFAVLCDLYNMERVRFERKHINRGHSLKLELINDGWEV